VQAGPGGLGRGRRRAQGGWTARPVSERCPVPPVPAAAPAGAGHARVRQTRPQPTAPGRVPPAGGRGRSTGAAARQAAPGTKKPPGGEHGGRRDGARELPAGAGSSFLESAAPLECVESGRTRPSAQELRDRALPYAGMTRIRFQGLASPRRPAITGDRPDRRAGLSATAAPL